MIKTARIATGEARAEGRQPSHDGEYISIYYNTDNPNLIVAEDNAGMFCLDDAGLNFDCLPEDQAAVLLEEWLGIQSEAYEITREDLGEPLRHCGSEAKAEMIRLGWIG